MITIEQNSTIKGLNLNNQSVKAHIATAKSKYPHGHVVMYVFHFAS